MTRKDIIKALRANGIDKVWGRGLSALAKDDLERALYLSQSQYAKTGDLHLSYSQIAQYQRCGLIYYYSRIDPGAPRFGVPAALAIGSAYHDGVDLAYSDKLGGHAFSKSAACDAIRERFKEFGNDIEILDDPVDHIEGYAMDLCEAYLDAVAPSIQPTGVEISRHVEVKNSPYHLMVITDLEAIPDVPCPVADCEIVVDHKTASKTPSAWIADFADQLTCEAAAYYSQYRKLPAAVEFHYAIRWKAKGPNLKNRDLYSIVRSGRGDRSVVGIRTLRSKRTMNDIQFFLRKSSTIGDAIKHGIFIPAPSGQWPCTPEGCEYWEYCHESR